MDSDSEYSLFDENESMISICESDNSSSSDSESLTEELYKNSMNEWEWEWDVDSSDFSSSLSYFDGRALGNDKIINPIDAFYKFISQDVIQLIIDQTNIYGKQRCIQRDGNAANWKDVEEYEMLAFLDICL